MSTKLKQARGSPEVELRLYVAGTSTRSIAALTDLKALCEAHLHGRYSLEVVDVLLAPALAAADQILVLPTVVRRVPAPIKRVMGDLSNTERVLVALDITDAR